MKNSDVEYTANSSKLPPSVLEGFNRVLKSTGKPLKKKVPVPKADESQTTNILQLNLTNQEKIEDQPDKDNRKTIKFSELGYQNLEKIEEKPFEYNTDFSSNIVDTIDRPSSNRIPQKAQVIIEVIEKVSEISDSEAEKIEQAEKLEEIKLIEEAKQAVEAKEIKETNKIEAKIEEIKIEQFKDQNIREDRPHMQTFNPLIINIPVANFGDFEEEVPLSAMMNENKTDNRAKDEEKIKEDAVNLAMNIRIEDDQRNTFNKIQMVNIKEEARKILAKYT